MSMKTSIIYGYGVDEQYLDKIETKKLVEFFKNHLPDNYKDMLEDVCEDIESYDSISIDNLDMDVCNEWLDNFECSTSGVAGRYSIISTVMTEETGIRFEYQDSSELNNYTIMFSEGLPWSMNKLELACTEVLLNDIFKKYFTELSVDVEPTNVSVEYFG